MFATSEEAIAAAVVQALSAHGPLPDDELMDILVADGIDLGPDREGLLTDILDEHEGPLLPLSDGRWVWLPAVLDGRFLTHRVSEPEVEHDMVVVDVDLAPLSMLTEHASYQRLTDGSPVADVSPLLDGAVLAERGVPDGVLPPDGALLFEPGHLAELGVSAGDLIALRVTPDGFELIAAPDAAPSEVASLVDALLDEVPGDLLSVDDAVWTLCAAHPGLFREPTLPLGELLAAGGLTQDGDWVAPAGFDFGAWRLRQRVRRLRSTYELSDDEALTVAATLRLYGNVRDMVDIAADSPEDEADREIEAFLQGMESVGSRRAADSDSGRNEVDRDRRTVGAILEFLAEPAVADAVRVETASTDRRAAEALGLFAETVEPMTPRPARPALRWLRAVAQERLGQVEYAERTLLEAESLDPSWPLTLIWLARYASDRGDADRGLALLRRAGMPPDHEMAQMLEQFRAAPRPDLGRNQPCWCGSGRKYKVCHLHREQLPLAERSGWLYQKAGTELFDGPLAALVSDVALTRAKHWESPDRMDRALDDPIVADAVLFEGGAFAEFLDRRGFLLPDDERLLAEQWLLVERSVYEVVAARRGRGMTMRDVRTGDVHEVREETASRQVKSGQLYCCRVVPAGDTMQIFGGIEPVALGERDALIALLDGEPDPVDLVAFLSRRFAPPAMRNTEGESLTLCDATLRVADPPALTEALDDEYDRRDDRPDESPGWFEHVVTHGLERIRATLDLRGDELRIQANSESRLQRVLDTIRRLDPSATLVRETREPADDLASIQRLAERSPGGPGTVVDPSDPAIAAALAEFVAGHEKAWLDESIPALAGYTPRQCADDPTRRPDLIRLLDSFPEDDGNPGMMSAARLRQALGLG